jgi:hypothetical protein
MIRSTSHNNILKKKSANNTPVKTRNVSKEVNNSPNNKNTNLFNIRPLALPIIK